MEALFFELIRVLERQREILKEMLAAAREHNIALRQNDISALKEITGLEEMLAPRLKAEDLRREQLQAAVEMELGLPRETSLRGLLSRVPEPHYPSLSRIADELREITEEIARLVELNGILNRRAMRFNELILRLLKSGRCDTYQPSGKAVIPAGSVPSLINKTV